MRKFLNRVRLDAPRAGDNDTYRTVVQKWRKATYSKQRRVCFNFGVQGFNFKAFKYRFINNNSPYTCLFRVIMTRFWFRRELEL